MVAFMFWNVADRPQRDLIAAACRSERVDLLVLAECKLDTGAVLDALNGEQSAAFFQEVLPAHPSVRLFSSLPGGSIEPLYDGLRYAIRLMKPPLGPELLVVAAHLPSKLHTSAEEQYFVARDLHHHIADCERRAGHANTIVIGDLNMNPFDTGMVAADGMHGMMSKRVAAKKSRLFQGKRWSYFYNPMWSRLGDESVGPPGTHFYHRGGLESLFWHTFDQVLLRPNLLAYYRSDSMRVISRIGERDLADEHKIDRSIGDHLPIIIDLATEGAA